MLNSIQSLMNFQIQSVHVIYIITLCVILFVLLLMELWYFVSNVISVDCTQLYFVLLK